MATKKTTKTKAPDEAKKASKTQGVPAETLKARPTTAETAKAEAAVEPTQADTRRLRKQKEAKTTKHAETGAR